MFCLLKTLPTTKKTIETTNYTNDTNIFLFLRLGEGLILHFYLSFCFLNFDILFSRKMQLYGLSKNVLSANQNQCLIKKL
jgi:hypothetical protein